MQKTADGSGKTCAQPSDGHDGYGFGAFQRSENLRDRLRTTAQSLFLSLRARAEAQKPLTNLQNRLCPSPNSQPTLAYPVEVPRQKQRRPLAEKMSAKAAEKTRAHV